MLWAALRGLGRSRAEGVLVGFGFGFELGLGGCDGHVVVGVGVRGYVVDALVVGGDRNL